MERKAFAACTFLIDSAVEALPSKWINPTNQCPWPRKQPKNFLALVKDPDSIPSDEWPLYDIVIEKYYGSQPDERVDSKIVNPPIIEGGIVADGACGAQGGAILIDGLIATQGDVIALTNEVRNLQEVVVTNFAALRQELGQHTQLLRQVLANQSTVQVDGCNDVFNLIPVASKAEYLLLEESLKEAKNYTTLIGGETETKAVNNVLIFVFKASATQELGLTNQSGKHAIRRSAVVKAIIESILATPGNEKLTRAKLPSKIGKWFRNTAFTSKPDNEGDTGSSANEVEEGDEGGEGNAE